MNKIQTTLIGIVSVFTIACGGSSNNNNDHVQLPEPEPTLGNIVEVATANGSFTTLVAALTATGLDETLANDSAEFTVFAPTDAAFDLLPEGTVEALLDDTAALSSILTYHVLTSKVDAAMAISLAGTAVGTGNGTTKIGLSLSGDKLFVNTALVTVTNIMASNGIIHVIDAVLMPPTITVGTKSIAAIASETPTLSKLVEALSAADLVDTFDDVRKSFTVFAPTDAAFLKLDSTSTLFQAILNDSDALAAILQQHVVEGAVDSIGAFAANGENVTTLGGTEIAVSIDQDSRTLMFGGATVEIKDIYASNGIIHVIDTVVVGDVALPSIGSLTDIASSNPDFSTLVTALQLTDLDTVLASADNSYTVFAPTNAAFDALPAGQLDALLADPDALKEVLLYHVLGGDPVFAEQAVGVAKSDANTITMASTAGDKAALSVVGDSLYINTAEVIISNVAADNGVIHAIDQVILPASVDADATSTIADIAGADSRFSTLVTALGAANLTSALADADASLTVFAPTNAAFDKLPDDVLSSLLDDPTALSSILLQHVVGAKISSVDAYAASGKQVTTLAENKLDVSLVDFTKAANTDDSVIAYDADKQRLVAGKGQTQAGYTVYAFDSDLGTDGSECTGGCESVWPPVLVAEGDSTDNIPGLGTITRQDDSVQVTYLGRPLYLYASDTAAGEAMGEGVGDKWWVITLPPVSLQVMGSNVITADISASNGVIHVIDTVITSAAE